MCEENNKNKFDIGFDGKEREMVISEWIQWEIAVRGTLTVCDAGKPITFLQKRCDVKKYCEGC